MRMTVIVSALLLGAHVCAAPPSHAQTLGDGDDLADYLSKRSVIVRMACIPIVEKIDPEADLGAHTIRPRIATASGFFLNRFGMIGTAYHVLDDLVAPKEVDTGSGKFLEYCEEEDVQIGFFRSSEIGRYDENLETKPNFPEIKSARDDRSRRRDVLFVQADLQGRNDAPYLCGSEVGARGDLDDVKIVVSAIAAPAKPAGRYQYRLEEGRSTAKPGPGDAIHFLVMKDIAAVPGMSGAPVVLAKNGEIAGIIHGFSEVGANPDDVKSYLVPFYLFDDTASDYGDDCSPAVSPEEAEIQRLETLFHQCSAQAAPVTSQCSARDKAGFHGRPHASCGIVVDAPAGRFFPAPTVTVIRQHFRQLNGPPPKEALRPQTTLVAGKPVTTAFVGRIGCTNSKGTGRTCDAQAVVTANSYPIACADVSKRLR